MKFFGHLYLAIPLMKKKIVNMILFTLLYLNLTKTAKQYVFNHFKIST